MTIEGKNILLISPEAWGQNFVSKHHYASYLSKNNKVYFLNPIKNSGKNPFGNINCQTETINNNLTVIQYQNLIPKLNKLPKNIQNRFYKKQAHQIQEFINVKEFDIVWSFDPFRFFNQKVWKSKYLIYHTVDVHFNQCYETDMAASSDLVLLSSELLRVNLEKFNSNIHYVGHSTDLNHFQKEHQKIILKGENKVKAGLVGNFNNNVDYDLIDDIAEKNPNVDFIFLGPYSTNNLGSHSVSNSNQIEQLQKKKNIFFMGAVNSSEIIKWVNSFDINLVLYREDRRDIIINPHKIMGYLYAGNITVCSWFSEYEKGRKEFIYMSQNNIDIPNIIKEVSEDLTFWNAPELVCKRREFAIEHSYDNTIIKIAKLMRN